MSRIHRELTTVPVTFRVPAPLHQLMQSETEKTGETMAEFGRRVVAGHFNTQQLVAEISDQIKQAETAIIQKIDSLAIEEAA